MKDGSIGDAEFTDGYINTACIEGISADDNDKTCTSMKRMWVLRVGKLRVGDEVAKPTAINHGEKPPRMTADMRKAKLKLSGEIRHNKLMCYTDVSTMVDVDTVINWVLMKPGMATPDTTSVTAKRKRHTYDNDDDDNDDCDDNNDDEMIQQITRAHTIPSPMAPPRPTTYTPIPGTVPIITPGAGGVFLPILDCGFHHTVSDELRKKFPALSKYYPEVFHRE